MAQTASITLTALPSAAINFTGTAAANFTATPGQQAAPLLSFTASVPAGASAASQVGELVTAHVIARPEATLLDAFI